MVDPIDLEWRARGILGWDGENAKRHAGALSPEEREYMVKDAYSCSPSHPPDEAPTDDAGLSLWWLQAMKEYVDSL